MYKVTVEHQGRELLHVISLLVRCLRMRGSSPSTRQRWEREILNATRSLEDLYAAGLSRDFLSTGVRRRPCERVVVAGDVPPAHQSDSSRTRQAGGCVG